MLVLRRAHENWKQNVHWKDKKPEIYQHILFQILPSVLCTLSLKFILLVFFVRIGQDLNLQFPSKCKSKLKFNDRNEPRQRRAFRWYFYLFNFMFGSTRVPLGLNKLWLPGQERQIAKTE